MAQGIRVLLSSNAKSDRTLTSSGSGEGDSTATVQAALCREAAAHPLAVAIVGEDGCTLSYVELLETVTRSALRLRAAGVQAESRVAVIVPNSAAATVAFLAVSHVGSCAPLNPAYRTAELISYLRALRVDFVLLPLDAPMEHHDAARALGVRILTMRPTPSAGVIGWEVEGPDIGPQAELPNPEATALLLHTSGTSSRPKVVPLSHRNLARSASDIVAATALGASDRSLVVMPLFHIHGLSAVLATIMSGGSFVCPPAFLAPQFLEWLRLLRPTWYTAAPSIHRAVAERAVLAGGTVASTLRFIRSASAPMPGRLGEELEAIFGVPFLEAYGMTEAGPQIASNRLPPAARKRGSVGRAAGPEVRIVDPAGRPLSPDRVGEIVIRGANVTSGYEDHPEANRVAFRDGWFHTGDEGMLDADGDLFVTGRLTDIINRGGEKIAPREIEEVLLQHPAVRQAVAFGVPDDRLGHDVFAAVVLAPDQTLSERALRQFAMQQLADFKVPRHICFCAAIPHAASGKLVRRELPELLSLLRAAPTATVARAYVAPRDEREASLAGIWEALLDVGTIGVDDDFFSLGGDSILAAQLLARVREATGVSLPLIDVFDEASTVARMSQRIAASAPSEEDRIPRLGARDAAPLSYAEEGLWLAEQFDPGHPVFNVYRVLSLSGPLDLIALRRALDAAVARHEALRTAFPAREGHPVREVADEAPLALTILDGRDGTDRPEQLALRATLEPFRLDTAPLMRVVLIRVPEKEQLLVIVAHHIVADAWSLQVLVNDLAELYSADMAGRPAALSALSVQPRDFAAWQREGQSQALAGQLEYWRNHLAGAPGLMRLPTDRARPPVRSFRGERIPVVLDAELLDRLKHRSQEEGATLFMVLLAGFNALLHEWTGEDDIVIGTHVAGRTRLEVEGLVGSYINTLALRSRLDPAATFRSLIRDARATAIGAYAHQDLPFNRLLEALRPVRSLAHAPLFQVKLRLQNVPGSPVAFAGVPGEPVEIDYGFLKVDLGLELVGRGDTLTGFMEYSTDLFDQATIADLVGRFTQLLHHLVASPDQPLRTLTGSVTRRGHAMSDNSPAPSGRGPSLRGARKTVTVTPTDLVRTGRLPGYDTIPLLIEPAVDGLDLLEWAAAQHDWIDAQLAQSGALLFRGFRVPDVATFESFAKTCTRTLLGYRNRSTPRSQVSGDVYTSTEFPADQSIPMHNEMSYTLSWPLKLWLHCVIPSTTGGETPLADSALVYQRIPAAIREKFAEKGVLYVRNFSKQRTQGFDLTWPDTFQTSDPAAVEAFCSENQMEWEWLPGERLRTRQRCQGVAAHPVTGEMLWFNQAHLFHISSLRPEIRSEMEAAFAREDLPRNSYYGDGSEIELETLDAVRAVYDQTNIAFPWQAGDIVMVDNMRVAHGRNPFTGPRKIVVAMAEAFSLGKASDD